MESCLLDLAKNEVQSLVNLVKDEAQYLCCFSSYVKNFEQKQKTLATKHKDVKRKFQKGKGVYSFKFEAQEWEREADDIIHIDTKIKENWFLGWCPNCWWKYRRGKELAEKTQHIERLLERCNSNIEAGRANVSDIKYLFSQDFIHFKSRESQFQDLLKRFKDENCTMIGLQGLGGTGKTSMAKEVGHELKKSKFIDKFIFLVVSQPPDFKKIRGELAKSLDLKLDQVEEEGHSSAILSKIIGMDEKLLVILDDVWAEFDLVEKLGIPFSHQCKGCNLLITTRSSHIFVELGCQMIQLQTLTSEEALNLFEAQSGLSNSYRGLKGLPQKIVKHCGGVPIAVVAIARALNNQPISVWKDALKTLEDRGLDQNLEEAYKCLKVSYDNLKKQKAKELLLIASLFPEDSEIPIKLLLKIGIGLGSFNENDKYHVTRSEVHGAIMELIYSSLLFNAEEERVKMHDLVRDVALRIGENNIQSLLDVGKPTKGNLRYLFWKKDKFPDEFDGDKLEVLLMLIDDSEGLIVSNTFFNEMKSLKVLMLANEERVPALSFTNSLQPLKDIQTLVLISLELGDISVLGNLLTIRTLWFFHCSIIELPKTFLQLKKLRSLEVESCEIEKNNPFEVIEICSQLEELTFVGNKCDFEEKDAISHNGSPISLHRYCISSVDLSDYCEKYGSMSRCFRVDELSNLVSDATFKQLVGRAEHLFFEGEGAQRIRKNLIPNIVPIDKEGVMNDLIVLLLSSHPDMKCLIDTQDHDQDVTAFCNLAELYLSEMGVEDLCRGPLPSGFLEQLEIMNLMECHNLKSILFNANYNLCHLKSVTLEDCPMLTSVFQPSTALSLMQLEELTIRRCSALEFIIMSEDGDSNQRSYYDSLFPKLKIIEIIGCHRLRVVLSIPLAGGLESLERIIIEKSEQLEYIFDKVQEGEDALLPSLIELKLEIVPILSGIIREFHHLMSSSMQKPSPSLSRHTSNNMNQSFATRAFSWVQACYPLNKLGPSNEETNIAITKHRSPGQKSTSEVDASTDGVPQSLAAQSLLVQPLRKIRKMDLWKCGNLISLSTPSMAASIISLEHLKIRQCHKLKCITTHDGDTQVDMNNCSIFPTLEELEIENCEELEIIFASAISTNIDKLKSLTIERVPKLKYVVGNYQKEQHSSNYNQNDEIHFNLPSLEILDIKYAPMVKSICSKKYKLELSSSLNVVIENCGIKSLTDYNTANSTTTEGLLASKKWIDAPPTFVKQLVLHAHCIRKMELAHVSLYSVSALFTLSIASTISWEELTIIECDGLKHLVTSEEDDYKQQINHGSIFPKLQNLEIRKCEDLEILFLSSISIKIEVLKSLAICHAPKLSYVVGKYQNDELHFDLPALEALYFKDVPELISIGPMKFKLVSPSLQKICLDEGQLTSNTTKEVDASTYGVPQSLAAQSLLVQPLKKIRKIDLWKCGNLISLSTPSMAASIISLEHLKIRQCHKLKYIMTHDEDTQVDMNNCSIFPTLEELEIEDCEELEIIFVSAISISLQKLKYMTIQEVPKLKYVVGNYQKEQHSSNYNQNDEIHFNLPSLEILNIKYAPMMKSICSKKYKLELSSSLNVVIENCGIKSLTDYNTANSTTTEEVHATTNGAPLFYVAQSLLIQPLKNIRKIDLVRCANLISLITLSIASAIVLEVLEIKECNQLKYIVADEGDDRTHKNYNSIFPKLKVLGVSNCNALEYLLPADAFRCPSHLESLRITVAPMLKYVFGRNQYEDSLTSDENQNIQIPLDFHALGDLCISDVPKLVSMCPQCYYLRAPSLRYVVLEPLLQSALRPFNEFLVWWHIEQHETKVMEMCWKTLETLKVCDSKREEIFDLTYMKTEKSRDELQPLTSSLKRLRLEDLSEVVTICVGPKCIIRFNSLQDLSISECKKLRVIFSASTVRSLPMLEFLNISKCEELVYIVEEDYETNADEPCFANLTYVEVKRCDKLKYLFSITSSDILPKLRDLDIRECYELEHVLIRRGEMKEMLMKKDVLPRLIYMKLKELTNLISICHGIDFQIWKDENKYAVRVQNCPNFSFYESSQVKEKGKVKLSSHLSIEQSLNMGEETQQSRFKKVPIHTSGHPNLTLLPTRDNTHASDKICEVEEEEQEEEQGALITSRRPRSGKKSSSSLPEQKLETFMHGDLFVPPSPKPCEDTKEIVEEGIIVEKPRMTDLSYDSNVIGQSNDKEVDPSVVNRTDSQKASLKDELVDNKVKRETIMKEPKSQEETRHDIQSHKKEEEKKEGGLVNTQGHQSDMNTKISLLKEKPKNPIHGDPNGPCATPILSDQTSKAVPLSPTSSKASPSNDDDIHVSDKSGAAAIGNVIPIPQPTTLCKFKETNVTQDESKANSSEHMSVDSSNHKQIEQKPSYSKGQLEHHDVTKSDINQALNAGGVQEIVEMMKLEASETSLLEEALKTHPQLLLSTNDRSTQMVCISYRVLIDILNILTTKTPFTITKSDKRLLEDKLKDASLLGFDKHWLQYIKTKVFDCDVSEDDHIQETLKVLDNDLNTNEAMLAATRNEEVEAARVVELAQKDLDVALKEHANVMANHTKLLKARQHVLARQNQCWDRIVAKKKPFGF